MTDLQPYSSSSELIKTNTITNHTTSWIELSHTAFDHNITQYRQVIGPDRALAVVVKNNAYGHGIDIITRWCEEHHDVNWLCVATLSEAVYLRKNGITKPILVLYYIDDDPVLAARYHVDLMVPDLQTMTWLHQVALAVQKQIVVHIKIDTGLNRFGFSPEQFKNVLSNLNQYPALIFRGMYTHFANSDSADQTFTLHQQQLFTDLISTLNKSSPLFTYRHSAKSGAVTCIDLGSTNLVRIGAGAYGLWPSQDVQQITRVQYPWFTLKPVLSLKTRMSHIKSVPADTSIGYSRAFTTSRPTTIGILPVGYNEGYQRRFSNAASVLVSTTTSCIAPVVGIVAMNTTCIDITNIPQASVGTEVTLIGADTPTTALELAYAIKSNNPREIVTALNPTIKRISVV